MRTILFAAVACSVAAAGYILLPSSAADAAKPMEAAASPVPPASPVRLVAHEWGTFTSFSGSNGVPVGFSPNNTDLPNFVYHQISPFSKSGRLQLNGLISMETPVVYFYTDRETTVDVKVDFPRGWITEWYPFAADSPQFDMTPRLNPAKDQGGQSIRWKARLLPGEKFEYPRGQHDDGNPYYHARATDAVPLQVEVPAKPDERRPELRGGSVVQRDNLLFYRGVGTFAPPVTVKAEGGGRVVVRNAAGGTISGLALVTARGGKVGFRALPEVAAGAELDAIIPEAVDRRAELAEYLAKELTAAGLYEKEARAMVKTWDHAWFGEEGTRLLYLVPRAKTDEVLPIQINPKPAELVRVLVGRHDFLTPEEEATADQQLKRLNAAEAEAQAAREALARLGRFSNEARNLAAKRLEGAGQR
jgi:hypothetical protein